MAGRAQRVHLGALALALLFSGASSGCRSRSNAGTSAPGGDASAPAAPATPSAARRRPVTTSGGIAVGNLNATIAERMKEGDASPHARLALVELLLARAQFLAKLDDLELAERLSQETAARFTKDGDAVLGRALARSALHRFDEASRDLDEAERLGASKQRISSARAGVLVARGRYDDAAALLPDDIERAGDGVALTTAAFIAARRRRMDDAERMFELARDRFRDVSPFPVAWMDFQRATVLEENGDERRARELYVEATEVLPEYAHAVVHVSTTEPAEKAIARLEAIRATSSDDPDVLAALAAAHRRAGHAAEHDRFVSLARVRYGEVVAKHREAFADHAARFWLGTGDDVHLALRLARDNARARPTEQALDLWMAAAAGADVAGEVCEAAVAMTKLAYLTDRGRAVATAGAAGCSDAGR